MEMQRTQPTDGRSSTRLAQLLVCSFALTMIPVTGSSSLFGQERAALKGHWGRVWSLAFSPDGKTLASCCEDDKIRLWDVRSGKRRAVLKVARSPKCLQPIETIAFSPSGNTLASAGWDVLVFDEEKFQSVGIVRLWDLQETKLSRTLKAHDLAWAVSFSPDGKTLASAGADKTIRLWDVQTGKAKRTLEGHKGWIWSVAFSPDGKTLASAGGYGVDKEGDDSGKFDSLVGELMLWNMETGKLKQRLEGHTHYIDSVAFLPHGRTLASQTTDDIKLWDTRTGKLKRTIREGFLEDFAISPDGRTLVAVGYDVVFWDLQTGKEKRRIEDPDYTFHSAAFSPDGKTLATGCSFGNIRLWDAKIEPQETAPRQDK